LALRTLLSERRSLACVRVVDCMMGSPALGSRGPDHGDAFASRGPRPHGFPLFSGRLFPHGAWALRQQSEQFASPIPRAALQKRLLKK
jgi:hypothetical protein